MVRILVQPGSNSAICLKFVNIIHLFYRDLRSYWHVLCATHLRS